MPFLVRTPLLPNEVILEAKDFINRLREAEILKDVTWEDVKTELNARTLTYVEAMQFMRWLIEENLTHDQRSQLLGSAIVIVGDAKLEKMVHLGHITSFVLPGRIQVEGGLPQFVLPPELGRTFSLKNLESLYVPFGVLIAVAGKNLAFPSG